MPKHKSHAALLAASITAGRTPHTATFETLHSTPHTLTLCVETARQAQHIPSGFEHAIPGLIIMFVLVTSGSTLLVFEHERGMLLRLAAAPKRLAVGLGHGCHAQTHQLRLTAAIGCIPCGSLGPNGFAVIALTNRHFRYQLLMQHVANALSGRQPSHSKRMRYLR